MRHTLATLEVIEAIRRQQRIADDEERRGAAIGTLARAFLPPTSAREAFDRSMDAVLQLAGRDAPSAPAGPTDDTTDDHETSRATREEAIGLAVLRLAFGADDITIHAETCHGTPDCTCEPVVIHVNHRPDDEHEGGA